MQEDILNWITDGDQDEEPKQLMWITGPAGTGKTAITGSIAETCEERGILAGSFFFSSYAGSAERRLKRGLIPTLVYCLLQHDSLECLRDDILSSIRRDPSIFDKRLRDQLQLLLLRPCHNNWRRIDRSCIPKVIVIDGLDEVEAANSRRLESREAIKANEDEQLDILRTVLQAARDRNFPFRIIVASRSERVIQEFFVNDAQDMTRQLTLDEKYEPNADISLFLRAKFTMIRRRYNLPPSWADASVVKTLVDNASGQFVYAATVVRYLESARTSPVARLKRVLCLDSAHIDTNPFALLDSLYAHIIGRSPNPTLAVKWILVIQKLGSKYPASFISQFLQDEAGYAHHLLENLAPLIRIPAPGDAHSPYELYHKSLGDFLRNPERSGEEIYRASSDDAFLPNQFLRTLVGECHSSSASQRAELDLHVIQLKVLSFLSKPRPNGRSFWRTSLTWEFKTNSSGRH